MTNLFELRLCNLGILIERRGVELCTKILSSGDTKAIKELLLPVNGIEPKVIATFFFLREIRTSSAGSELFIVDNSDVDWKVVRYLRDWCQISKAIDCATGNFEIGALLALDGEWQKVDQFRILVGCDVTPRTKEAFLEAFDQTKRRLDDSIESEKDRAKSKPSTLLLPYHYAPARNL